MRTERLNENNAQALARRHFLDPDYEFAPISNHVPLQERSEYPYFGFVDIEIEDVPAFVMFSNNDDRVAQTYFWYGPDAVETLSLRVWRELSRTSRTVFDIGAFSGVYGLAAARANPQSRVRAFEPIRRIYDRLLINIKANGLGGQVSAHDIALSDEDGTAEMHVFKGPSVLATGSSLVQKADHEIHQVEIVDAARFDTFYEQQNVHTVDLVKIDVEQAEHRVIDGMAATIERHRPHLLVEVVSNERLEAIHALLSPHGYHFVDLDEGAQRCYIDELGPHPAVRNTLFTPLERRELNRLSARLPPVQRRGPSPRFITPRAERPPLAKRLQEAVRPGE